MFPRAALPGGSPPPPELFLKDKRRSSTRSLTSTSKSDRGLMAVLNLFLPGFGAGGPGGPQVWGKIFQQTFVGLPDLSGFNLSEWSS